MHGRRHGQYARWGSRTGTVRRTRYYGRGEPWSGSGAFVARGWCIGGNDRYYQEAEPERGEAPLSSAVSSPLEHCLERLHVRRHEQHFDVVGAGELTHGLERGWRSKDDDADAAHGRPAEKLRTA